jgi:hypothetical protein
MDPHYEWSQKPNIESWESAGGTRLFVGFSHGQDCKGCKGFYIKARGSWEAMRQFKRVDRSAHPYGERRYLALAGGDYNQMMGYYHVPSVTTQIPPAPTDWEGEGRAYENWKMSDERTLGAEYVDPGY